MGEIIHGDYIRWVNEDTLHAVTNYHLHKALYSGHNDHNYFEIAHTVKRLYEMGGSRHDGLKLYNFADNHDVELKHNEAFEEMTVEELQAAILERMKHNGPVTEQMKKDVKGNIYHNSLVTWIKSFN